MSSARSAVCREIYWTCWVGGLLPGENLATLGESQNSLKCLMWSEYMGPV